MAKQPKGRKYDNLEACINFWYGDKHEPKIEVLVRVGVNVAGCLAEVTRDCLTVKITGGKLQQVEPENIKGIELTWRGNEFTSAAGQSMMGELDGTGREGVTIQSKTFKHRITPDGKGNWYFETIS